ncbi:hypothetical protein ACIVBQ_000430 [Tenacibaculum discolor]
MSQHQQAEQFERNIKAMLFDVAKKIGTTTGYMDYYFKILYKCKSQKQAYEAVNVLHFLIFGQYKYSDFDSFRRSRNHHLKK